MRRELWDESKLPPTRKEVRELVTVGMDLKTSEGATSEQAASEVALTYRREAKLHAEAGDDDRATACEEASRVAVVLHAVFASERLRRQRRKRLLILAIVVVVLGALAGLLLR